MKRLRDSSLGKVVCRGQAQVLHRLDAVVRQLVEVLLGIGSPEELVLSVNHQKIARKPLRINLLKIRTIHQFSTEKVKNRHFWSSASFEIFHQEECFF